VAAILRMRARDERVFVKQKRVGHGASIRFGTKMLLMPVFPIAKTLFSAGIFDSAKFGIQNALLNESNEGEKLCFRHQIPLCAELRLDRPSEHDVFSHTRLGFIPFLKIVVTLDQMQGLITFGEIVADCALSGER
jgi:hypothetical protein